MGAEVDNNDTTKVEIIEAAGHTARAFGSSEQALDLMATSIHRLLMCLWINASREPWHARDKAQIQYELSRLVAFIGAVQYRIALYQQFWDRAQ